MRTQATLATAALLASGALFGGPVASDRLASEAQAQDKAPPGGKAVPVTADNYIRAETDRAFAGGDQGVAQQDGGLVRQAGSVAP
jgi:hypothetical protein